MNLFIIFCVVILSMALDKLSAPPINKIFSPKIILLKTLVISTLYTILFLMTSKVYFSASATLGLELLLIAISNIKFKTLKEPLIFSDIVLYSQALKFPRLYFPFMGAVTYIYIFMATIIISTLIVVEPPIPKQNIMFFYFYLIISIPTIIISSNLFSVTLDPITDIKNNGLLNSLLIYTIKNIIEKENNKKSSLDKLYLKKNSLEQHIICIQSESFFDARRLNESISKNILTTYDKLINESIVYGQLSVPAWGANTMRTEFSFLTGIKNENLNYKKFYPHFFYRKKSIPSISQYLKDQGYKAICIHPHPAGFFKRDELFKNLGFDEFIDIDYFDKSQNFGPYISDEAVNNKIIEILEKYKLEKLFIFVITMENHGPLHLETVSSKEGDNYHKISKLDRVDDLTVYLRHLKNTDKMLYKLRRHLIKSTIDTSVCFFGDHIPSMPKIYSQLNYINKRTDYFLWSNKKEKHSSKNEEKNIEALTKLVLEK